MDQDPPEDIMREYDTRVVTSLKALQQTAASIIKVREGKRKGLEAERKERVAAETERLREGQKERKERIREMEWAANACICWRRRRHRQRDAEEKEREEAERRLEAGRGRTTRAMGMTLKTTHCELEGEGQRRKRGDRNDDAASAGGKRRQRGDEDGEQRGEQTASGAREGDHAGENRRDEGKETRPARKRRQTARYVAGPATGSAGKQKEQDQEHGDEGRREALRRQAAEAAAKVTTAMLTTGGTVEGAKVGPSSIAEGELGLLATRRLEKFEVCSIYTGEIFRTGTAQPPETVPDELSRHTAAGGTQLDGSDDESEDDFDSVAARCNFDWPAASNEPKRGTRATHFVRYEEIQLGKAAAQVMVLFAERGVKEGQEITWSYGDSYRSHRKEMGYKAGTKADPNAITPQQARTAFARYCKEIDVTKEELAWNFGCISASQNNEQEAVLVRELILSNNKRLYHGAQSAADRTAATADMAETSVKQRAAGMEGGSDGDGDGDGGEGEEGGPLTPDSERGREERGREEANATCAEDEDINWDDAAEGIGEGIEGPEGFRDSDDDDEERGGDGGATRRRGEIANGPSREGDGGARGNNGDATDDANRGTDAGGDGEGDSDVEVDATVSRAPPKGGRTAMEVTEWRANGTIRKGRARRMEKEVPRRPWWRGGTGGRKKGGEDERPAQTASRQRLLAISRHSPRTLATWEGFVKDGLKNIRTKKRRREEPAEDAVT